MSPVFAARLSGALLIVALCPGLATAGGAGERPTGVPLEVLGRPLTLPRGIFRVALDIEVSVATRRVLEPVSLAPDVAFGVTDAITLGVSHSSRSLGLVDSGRGLCITGEAKGCPRIYDNLTLDSLLSLSRGWAASSGRARLVISSLEPAKLSLRLGALARLRYRKVAVVVDPHLSFGLTARDRGNAHFLNIPVWLQAQAGRRLTFSLRSGVEGTLSGFADKFAVPVGLGVVVAAPCSLDVGAELAIERPLGPQNDIKSRHLVVYVSWHLSTARGRRGAGWCRAD